MVLDSASTCESHAETGENYKRWTIIGRFSFLNMITFLRLMLWRWLYLTLVTFCQACVMLTNFHLVPRLRITGKIPPLPLPAFMAFPLYFNPLQIFSFYFNLCFKWLGRNKIAIWFISGGFSNFAKKEYGSYLAGYPTSQRTTSINVIHNFITLKSSLGLAFNGQSW
jgi:hypothetical protein